MWWFYAAIALIILAIAYGVNEHTQRRKVEAELQEQKESNANNKLNQTTPPSNDASGASVQPAAVASQVTTHPAFPFPPPVTMAANGTLATTLTSLHHQAPDNPILGDRDMTQYTRSVHGNWERAGALKNAMGYQLTLERRVRDYGTGKVEFRVQTGEGSYTEIQYPLMPNQTLHVPGLEQAGPFHVDMVQEPFWGYRPTNM